MQRLIWFMVHLVPVVWVGWLVGLWQRRQSYVVRRGGLCLLLMGCNSLVLWGGLSWFLQPPVPTPAQKAAIDRANQVIARVWMSPPPDTPRVQTGGGWSIMDVSAMRQMIEQTPQAREWVDAWEWVAAPAPVHNGNVSFESGTMCGVFLRYVHQGQYRPPAQTYGSECPYGMAVNTVGP